MTLSFEEQYPFITYFTDAIGYIEMGNDDDSPLTSFIRALDAGGMAWEGEDEYPTLDAAFQDLEQGIADYMEENGIGVE